MHTHLAPRTHAPLILITMPADSRRTAEPATQDAPQGASGGASQAPAEIDRAWREINDAQKELDTQRREIDAEWRKLDCCNYAKRNNLRLISTV